MEPRVVLGFVPSWAWRRHQHILDIKLELAEDLGVAGADLLQHVVDRLVQTRPHSTRLRVAVPVDSCSVDQIFLSALTYTQVEAPLPVVVVVVVAAAAIVVVVVVLKAST